MSTKKILLLLVLLSLVGMIGLWSWIVSRGGLTQRMSAESGQGEKSVRLAKQPEVPQKIVSGVGGQAISGKKDAVAQGSKEVEDPQLEEKIRKLFCTIEGAQKVLAEMKTVLSCPDPGNMGAQMQAGFAVDILSRQGNAILPYLKDFMESKSIWHREFARDMLFKIGTPEARSLIRGQFWEFYGKAKNWEKIDASSAALSYPAMEIQMEEQGVKEYWEARHIFKQMLSFGSKDTGEIATRLMGVDNGLGVLAAKHLWRTLGEKYRDEFYKYSKAKIDSEVFYTFIKELRDTFLDGRESEYEGIKKVQEDFDKRAIGLCEDTKIGEYVLENVIEYLSKAEPDWFAEHWVRLYEFYQKNTPSAWDLNVAIWRGVLNNEKAKQNIEKLKNVAEDYKYEDFVKSLREEEERRKEQEKRESRQK